MDHEDDIRLDINDFGKLRSVKMWINAVERGEWCELTVMDRILVEEEVS